MPGDHSFGDVILYLPPNMGLNVWSPGIHNILKSLDSRFRGDDENGCFLNFYEFVNFEKHKCYASCYAWFIELLNFTRKGFIKCLRINSSLVGSPVTANTKCPAEMSRYVETQ